MANTCKVYTFYMCPFSTVISLYIFAVCVDYLDYILKIAYRYIVRTLQISEISGYKSTVQCTKTELLGHFYFSDLEETPFLDQLGAILFGF